MKLKTLSICAVALTVGLASAEPAAAAMTPKENLGHKLYMDPSLSLYKNQSCMTCHHPMAAFADLESSQILNRFSSRYDAYLAGDATALTAQELWGLQLFEDPAKGNCAACHPSQPAADGTPPLFTDFSYDNLGLPKSDNPQIARNPTDYGLGGRAEIAAVDPIRVREPVTRKWVTVSSGQAGKFKVSSLRNIAQTAPYGHNGVIPTLKDWMRFYNSRDVPEANWPPPEVQMNVNVDELGNLGLTEAEMDAIAAFLGTLNDGCGCGGGGGHGGGEGGMR